MIKLNYIILLVSALSHGMLNPDAEILAGSRDASSAEESDLAQLDAEAAERRLEAAERRLEVEEIRRQLRDNDVRFVEELIQIHEGTMREIADFCMLSGLILMVIGNVVTDTPMESREALIICSCLGILSWRQLPESWRSGAFLTNLFRRHTTSLEEPLLQV